jgi:hypothetical protein
MGRTGSFWPAEDGKKPQGSRFCREITRTKTENGNCPADVIALLVLSQFPFLYPKENKPSPGAAMVLQIIGK